MKDLGFVGTNIADMGNNLLKDFHLRVAWCEAPPFFYLALGALVSGRLAMLIIIVKGTGCLQDVIN